VLKFIGGHFCEVQIISLRPKSLPKHLTPAPDVVVLEMAVRELAYVYTGQTLFMERWVRVPKSVWEPAAKNRQINVLYAPQNPKINQPADIARPSYTNAFGLALLGVLMSVVCIFYWRGYKV
jgi:hypothetical protein